MLLLSLLLLSVSAIVLKGAPDIIQIGVTHLDQVKHQLRQATGASWRPEIVDNVNVTLRDGSSYRVRLTRTYSFMSEPYIELIKAQPAVGPWAPFNDEFGVRPRSTTIWRIAAADFPAVRAQIEASPFKEVAVGPGFVYYETVAGVQMAIFRSSLTPHPNDGLPNVPPTGVSDMGQMTFISYGVKANASNHTQIPQDDLIIHEAYTEATGGGVQWDVNAQFTNAPFYVNGSLMHFNQSNLEWTCEAPYINPMGFLPNWPILGGTAHSTDFSQGWNPPGSGIDQPGVDAMNAAIDQITEAGFESQLRMDAFLIGVPFHVDIFHYFVGVDGLDIQILNLAFENHPTAQCQQQRRR